MIRSERRSGRGAAYQSQTALAGLPGWALLALVGFRGAGRARPGRRLPVLAPLGTPREQGGTRSTSRQQRFCRGLRVNEAQRLGLPAGSALRTISCGQPAGNLISAVAFGEKSARRPRPASGEQTKVCEARPRGRALLMFNRVQGNRASPPSSSSRDADPPPFANAGQGCVEASPSAAHLSVLPCRSLLSLEVMLK